ncbi:MULTISPECIES: DUF1488 family protein [Nitrobacter]|uniref:Uncharacterized protein n=2 Tax=Nitrobacter winogradskyi TaxID=913 RepID=A0A4Y3WFU3_NITWI|nr:MULTISPECIES: DUF1488 family protein [Nitrobacter]MCP2001086.1 hypothetical protein [Nitrobacter winogradskyi]MCV0387902.1 DUF1488 domain-containing protein [Nitrobacter sp.]GEC17398.1 hypothetical protein NWI01_32900 [Nitrobacter winogradskyi]
MTLTRGAFDRFEYDRMVVLFSMMNDEVEIPCAISTDALDSMENSGRIAPAQRAAQFERLRVRIEACAIRKFQLSEFEGKPPGLILRTTDFR